MTRTMVIGRADARQCAAFDTVQRAQRAGIAALAFFGVMVWGVLGSTTSLPSEALRGSFVGAAADASLGIGAGAKVLVGGNKNSVVLQPLSVQGQTGVNLAVGVSGLKLEER